MNADNLSLLIHIDMNCKEVKLLNLLSYKFNRYIRIGKKSIIAAIYDLKFNSRISTDIW